MDFTGIWIGLCWTLGAVLVGALLVYSARRKGSPISYSATAFLAFLFMVSFCFSEFIIVLFTLTPTRSAVGQSLAGAALFIFPLISAPVAFAMGYLGIGTYLKLRAGREMSDMDLRGYSLSAGALCALVLMLLLRWMK